jgi:AcrR family transcriptional regulator
MERLAKIHLVSKSLFFRLGIKNVSMDDVSKALKISKKTLYKCFNDKSDLVRAAVLDHFMQIESSLEDFSKTNSHPIHELLAMTNFAVQQLSQVRPSVIQDLKKYHPEIYQEMVQMREKSIIQRLSGNIDKGRDQGIYRLEFDKKMISKSFALLIYSYTEQISQKADEDYNPQLLFQLMEYHIRGISTLNGLKELESVFSSYEQNKLPQIKTTEERINEINS